MSEATLVCQGPDCGHDPNWHGRRAGIPPERCHHPGCHCTQWQAPVVPTHPRLPDPTQDRDLYLAWCHAVDIAVHGGDAEAGYAVMMTEISRWQRRAHGLPPLPVRQAQSQKQAQ